MYIYIYIISFSEDADLTFKKNIGSAEIDIIEKTKNETYMSNF